MPRRLTHTESGAEAEAFVARRLERDGHRVLLRNVRTPAGEIDLLTRRRGVYHVVEVKARRADAPCGTGTDALTQAKLARVARAGRALLAKRGLADAPRALVGASVVLDEHGRPQSVQFHTVEEIQ